MALFTSSFSFGGGGTRPRGGPPAKPNVRADYVLRAELGRGTYGVVYAATRKRDLSACAVKEIAKLRIRDPARLQTLRDEVTIMRKLSHPNVLELYDFYENPRHLHLALELCTGGEVFEKIVAQRGGLTEPDAARVLRQALGAVEHCHARRVVHRDLKPQNLLLKKSVDHVRDTDVKLCDFGVSRLGPEGGPVGDAAEGTLHELIGSVPYIAPEVFARSYGPQCDLWSLARRDCLRSTFLDYSRLDALLFTAMAWIFHSRVYYC